MLYISYIYSVGDTPRRVDTQVIYRCVLQSLRQYIKSALKNPHHSKNYFSLWNLHILI